MSGINLWLIDNGITPAWQMDWVDHLRPSASGGPASLENGVCTSHTFNFKKRNNASDNILFFHNGSITEQYILAYGPPDEAVVRRLQRLRNLEPIDWYFNRSLANIFIAFDWRCDLELKDVRAKRDDEYWFSAAWRRLSKYQRGRSKESLQERGLVLEHRPFGTSELIRAEKIENESEFRQWAESLYPVYRVNVRLIRGYFSNVKDSERPRFDLSDFEEDERVNPEILRSIRTHQLLQQK